MANITEDFSFPKLITSTNTTTTTTNNNNPISLWRISSLVFPDHDEEKEADRGGEEDHGAPVRKHKSFSEIEVGDSETRMDLLWEDFNKKELQRVSSLDNRIKTRPIVISGDNYVINNVNDCRFCFNDGVGDQASSNDLVQGLKVKASDRKACLVRQNKRTGTVVFLRALRKLFSLHKLVRDKKSN